MAFKMTGAPFQKSALKHDGNHNGLSEADHAAASKAQTEGRAGEAAKTALAAAKAAYAANEKRIKTLTRGWKNNPEVGKEKTQEFLEKRSGLWAAVVAAGGGR